MKLFMFFQTTAVGIVALLSLVKFSNAADTDDNEIEAFGQRRLRQPFPRIPSLVQVVAETPVTTTTTTTTTPAPRARARRRSFDALLGSLNTVATTTATTARRRRRRSFNSFLPDIDIATTPAETTPVTVAATTATATTSTIIATTAVAATTVATAVTTVADTIATTNDNSTEVTTEASTTTTTTNDDNSTEVTTEATTIVTDDNSTEVTTEATIVVTDDNSTEMTTEATTIVTDDNSTEVTTEATTVVTDDNSTEITTEATAIVTDDNSTEVTTEATTVVTDDNSTEATTKATAVTNITTMESNVCQRDGCDASLTCQTDASCLTECNVTVCQVCEICVPYCTQQTCKGGCCQDSKCDDASQLPGCLQFDGDGAGCSSCPTTSCATTASQEKQLVCQQSNCCAEDRRFRLLKDLSQFEQYPDQRRIQDILHEIDEGDLDAKYLHANRALPTRTLAGAVHHVETAFENTEFVTNRQKQEFKVPIAANELIDLLGENNVLGLLEFLSIYTGQEGQPVTSVFFQRFDHDNDIVSPYHTDGSAISLVVLLNDDYDGGEMIFLTHDGPVVVETEAGAATVHGPGMVHGNSAVDGVKYQLTLLTFADTNKACMFDGLLDFEQE